MQRGASHLLTVSARRPPKKGYAYLFGGILQVSAGKLQRKKGGSDWRLQPLISLEKVCARLGGPEWPFADKTAAEETGMVDKWDIRIQRREGADGAEYGQLRADISLCRQWDVSAVNKDPQVGMVFKFQSSAVFLWHGGLEKSWTYVGDKLWKMLPDRVQNLHQRRYSRDELGGTCTFMKTKERERNEAWTLLSNNGRVTD